MNYGKDPHLMPVDVKLESDQTQKEMQSIITEFQTRLFQELACGTKNVVFSPFLLLSKLAMVASFTSGQTRAELTHCIFGNKNISVDDISRFKHSLKAYLDAMKEASYFMFSSSFYLDWIYSDCLKSHFRQEASSYFGCSVKPLSFTTNLFASLKEINEDVYFSTVGNVKSVMFRAESDVKALLLDVLYFRGTPEVSFTPSMSFRDNFEVNIQENSGDRIFHREIVYIRGLGTVRTGVFEPLKALIFEIPYKYSDVCLKIILPPSSDTAVAKFLTQTNSVDLQKCILDSSRLVERKVDFRMPRLRIGAKLCFKPILDKLQVSSLFKTRLDLSGMMMTKESSTGLAINEIIQKVLFCVDEVENKVSRKQVRQISHANPDYCQTQINRPFLIAITAGPENRKIILMLGFVNDPTEFEVNKF